MCRLAPLALLVCIACGPINTAVSDSGAGGGAGAVDSGTGGTWVPCSNTNRCPTNQFCFNGLCAIGCTAQSDCAPGQYCDLSQFGDRLCHDKVVSTCPESACAATQVCSNGFCSTPPPSNQCTVGEAEDGCDRHSVCAKNETAKCYTLPACPESGRCPTGTIGAVCNEGLIPSKARVCLTGLCIENSHCPASLHCVKIGAAAFGLCSSGSVGMTCNQQSDCDTGLTCHQGLPGYPGVCSP